MPSVTYYFSLVSPWAYIGHRPFLDLVRRYDVSVDYRPVALASVFADTGGLPLPKRHPVRQRYRMLELQRWRAKRGLAFNVHPRHWPFDVNRADRLVIALVAAGHDPATFMQLAFGAVWEEERDLGSADVLKQLLAQANIDAGALIEAAESEATAEPYAQNYRNAVAADVFGSPAYVLDGEVFWGQDRLELLGDALASGRPPFCPTPDTKRAAGSAARRDVKG